MERSPDASNKKEIEEIIGQMRCPKDFECYKSGLEILWSAKDIGLETFVECLEEDPKKCSLLASFGLESLCQCPLLVYT
jgi:hypothetical protein